MDLTKNVAYQNLTKHIGIRYQYIRKKVINDPGGGRDDTSWMTERAISGNRLAFTFDELYFAGEAAVLCTFSDASLGGLSVVPTQVRT
ncbi:hypothetical protein PHMEG_00029867 [Phytophthora megakarya]|uniref:Uncharacterized protein n=1 Tax=Phytophthora megakarya TaxID=4795 RepID=A0A225V1N0_9STRA|nr:hypothetical protein PHMEG_00029867 [Phytophthora megakarya]